MWREKLVSCNESSLSDTGEHGLVVEPDFLSAPMLIKSILKGVDAGGILGGWWQAVPKRNYSVTEE